MSEKLCKLHFYTHTYLATRYSHPSPQHKKAAVESLLGKNEPKHVPSTTQNTTQENQELAN